MTKTKNNFFNKISITALGFLLFIPTLTYCLSQAAEDSTYFETPYTLVTESIKERLAADNLNNLVLKDFFVKRKLLWIAYILDNKAQQTLLNLQIKATENNLELPKDLKRFLISHYLNRRNDLLYNA